MMRPTHPHNGKWWNQQEGRLRKYVTANSVTKDTTFTELYHGIDNTSLGGRIPKAALAELCRLLHIEPAGLPPT